jgi:hypothetical protein
LNNEKSRSSSLTDFQFRISYLWGIKEVKPIDGKEKEYEPSNTEMVSYRLGRDSGIHFEPSVERVVLGRRAPGTAWDCRRF